MKALIFDIYKGTTHDGPGTRDTVFFKGCPLKCKWCHNPEGIDFYNDVWQDKALCIGCGECIKACENKAINVTSDGISINSSCKKCFVCAEVCPSKAITKIAEEYTPEALAEEIMKDKEYFDISGGGVTVSGGEAAFHAEFVSEFFRIMKQKGISTALDTSGFCDPNVFSKILENTDIVLYDLKVIDNFLHKEWTGVDNDIILENIKNIKNKRLWIRTPLIPNFTANENVIHNISRFIKENIMDKVERWELCAFNNSCYKKYLKLNKEWELKGAGLITSHQSEQFLEIAKTSGVNQIICSGILNNQKER